jgi:hypothetical protein
MAEQPFPLTDPELLDFNAALMADYDEERAHENLERYGDVFRYQLLMALDISQWAESLADPRGPTRNAMDARQMLGWVDALQNVAACLRQGDYLPGGSRFEGMRRTGQ